MRRSVRVVHTAAAFGDRPAEVVTSSALDAGTFPRQRNSVPPIAGPRCRSNSERGGLRSLRDAPGQCAFTRRSGTADLSARLSSENRSTEIPVENLSDCSAWTDRAVEAGFVTFAGSRRRRRGTNHTGALLALRVRAQRKPAFKRR